MEQAAADFDVAPRGLAPASAVAATIARGAASVPIISHRTQVGTHPENSRSGLEAAVASGADGVELDVRATRDGRIVLMHDRSLARTLGDHRNVDEVDYADLMRLTPFGEPEGATVATLEEALGRCSGRLRPVIDVKQRGISRRLRGVLHAFEGRVEPWVWSHDPAIAYECVTTLGTAVPVSLIIRPWVVRRWRTPALMKQARATGLSGLVFEEPFVSEELIERAHRAGLALHCGRTNDIDDIERILALAPTSMCCDFPERALSYRRITPCAAPSAGEAERDGADERFSAA